jgi:UDP-N-acetylmuramoyl-tripeptide--D-alanyl-D-alanine ligase
MRGWDAARVAAAAGAELVRSHDGEPVRVAIDSRAAGPGDLFVGLVGEHTDGGAFAQGALDAGAWGALVSPAFADVTGGAVLTAADPLAAMGRLAREWRRALGASVIAVTGSVGKTSTKELLTSLLAPVRRTVASRANFNTDIGMPPEILAADPGTQVLVLEAAMRGFGEIATLRDICEPDVGVITNIAPVHLEQVGSLEGVARAKAELLPGVATAVVPAGEPLLEPYLDGLQVTRFGPGGDVEIDGDGIVAFGERLDLELAFRAEHHRINTLAAVAACLAIGVRPSGRVELPVGHLRGERIELPGGALVINDCYNASPLSMRAALAELSAEPAEGRRVAVLGDMLELGAREAELHREVGEEATAAGVDVLVTVGPRAAAMLDTFDGESYAVADAAEAASLVDEILEPTDLLLVKGSRGVGLEVVAEALLEAAPHG